MKLSFSLGTKAKAPVGEAPSLQKPTAFGSFDEDDEAPTASSSKIAVKPVAASSWRPNRRKDAKVDASVMQYDEVYDDMKEAEARAKEASQGQKKDKKAKYMTNLLASAETRKLDFVRAEEKLMQREREKEGGEFDHKEKFVTPAYKEQMAAMRQAEEEEKEREEKERKKRKGLPGMGAWYSEYLNMSSEQHEAIALATAKAAAEAEIAAASDLTIRKPLKVAPDPDSVFKPNIDSDKIEAARASGVDVEVNDDNQLVDKRELLLAGLNLSAPNTRRLGLGSKSSAKRDEAPVVYRAAGTAASRREIEARQAKELEKQFAEERERLALEQEQKEREERERFVKRKNTETDVQSAKERYLERKRQKLEEKPQA